MRILVLIAFLITIPALCIDSSILQNAPENLLDRNKRAAPASGIEQILDRHLPLGRVFNALYLEMELDDKKIDGLDIVASMYDLKDRMSLENLVSLKVDGLAEKLKKLDKAVKAVPEGIGQIADVDLITEKYKVVQGINQTVRETMLKATSAENVPVLKEPGEGLITFTNLKENIARIALTKLEIIKNAKQTPGKTIDELATCITDLKKFSRLPILLNELKVLSEKSLDHLITGFRIANEVQNKTALFVELKDQFAKIGTELAQLQPLISENVTFSGIENRLKTVGTVFRPFSDEVKNISISSAFMSNHDLSSFENDMNNNWMKSILNEGRDLKDILNSLKKFKETVSTFNQLRNSSETALRAGISISVSFGVELMSSLNLHTSFSHEFKIDLLLDCLNVSTAENKTLRLEELETLSTNVNALKLSVLSLEQITTKVDFAGTKTKLNELWTTLDEARESGSLKNWFDGTNYKDLEKLLKELDPNLEQMKQNGTLIEFVQSIATEGEKVKQAQEWIAGFQFIHPTCDSIFNLNFDKIRNLNKIPRALAKMKSGPHIEKIQEMAQVLPKLQMGLKSFTSSNASRNSKSPANSTPKPKTPKSKRVKRSASEIKINRESLLEVAFATRSLELMKKIEEMKADFKTVYEKGARVVMSISNTTDLENRKKIEEAWKDFASFKKDLEMFQDKNTKSVKAMSSEPEKKLVDIGKVYKSIQVFQFSKQDQLQKMRDSLKYLDVTNSELEKALDNLEEPLSMNWGLVHTNFQKVSSILPGLEKDFMEFFAAGDDERDGKFDMNIVMYAGGGFGALIILALAVCLILYCVFIFDPDMKKKPPKEPIYKLVQDDQYEHSYMQIQDARLEINKRDKNGDTPIYQALRKGDFEAIEVLLKKGAVLDACCNGVACRPALFDLVLIKKESLCRKFLKAGSNPNVWDATGDSANTWADHYGMLELFQYFHEKRKDEEPKRILPEVPRYWKVLVFDKKKSLKFYKKKFLPARIKKHITWGYKEGMKLNSFSHIVVPDRLLYDEFTLQLNDKNLLTFRLLACWGNLMGIDWLQDLADKKVHERAMDMDYNYFIRNVEYRGAVHMDTVLKQKNSIHQLRPGLLVNTVITILPSKNDDERNKQREEIKELIEIYGGEYSSKVITVGQEKKEMPYYSIDDDNLAAQNRIWVLKYIDSDFDPKWREQPLVVTLSDIHLLFECIARWEILNFYNDIVKADYDKKMDTLISMDKLPGMDRVKSMAKKDTAESQVARLRKGKLRMKKK